MIRRDYHMHTTYCDGANTAEEMVQAAISRGLEEIGISSHSHTPFDESYCMSHESTEQYRQELLALREKYKDQISLRIGLEMDIYSDADTSAFDYCIGSVHYIRVEAPGNGPGENEETAGNGVGQDAVPEGCLYFEDEDKAFVYIPVDESPEILRAAADAYFDGDLIALAVHYFDTVCKLFGRIDCDIIGHFDLITKFNEGGVLFDEEDPRYVRAWQRAVWRLLMHDVPFEINTGAMSKGYRSEPYPAAPIREYIRNKGGRFILSSDSHRTDTLCYAFEKYEGEV